MTDNDPFLKELQQRADSAHRSVDRADDVPQELWQRVRAQVNTEEEERSDMNTITMPVSPAPLSQTAAPARSRGFGHYANLAATIAIVIGVALAGWFVTMQVNQQGGSIDQFAGILGTPEVAQSQTCDVEPLSAERVMEIVKNPYPFMANGPAGEPMQPENPDNLFTTGLQEASAWDVVILAEPSPQRPSDQVFESSSDFADAYLRCLAHGTKGQVWSFYSPIYIQQEVLEEFPVFANEEEVSERVSELITRPGWESVYFTTTAVSAYEPETVSVNPDPALALQRQTPRTMYQHIVSIGVSFEDADGRTIYLTSGTGNEMVRDPNGSTFYMTVALGWFEYSDAWYVIPVGF